MKITAQGLAALTKHIVRADEAQGVGCRKIECIKTLRSIVPQGQ